MEPNSIKDVNDVKRFVFGLLIGFGLAFAFSAQAEEVKNFVGLKIQTQYQVTVDGEVIEHPAIAVNGVSYLPTRAIAEMAGYDVYFNSKTGIRLTKRVKTLPQSEVEELDGDAVRTVDKEAVQQRIKEIEYDLQRARTDHLPLLEYAINDPHATEEGRVEGRRLKAELEAQIAQLEAEKAELEAQLASMP